MAPDRREMRLVTRATGPISCDMGRISRGRTPRRVRQAAGRYFTDFAFSWMRLITLYFRP